MYRSSATTAAKGFHALTSTGAIVQVEPRIFIDILSRGIEENPLVITHHRKWAFGSDHQYLTCYKGLYFYVEEKEPLVLPKEVELIVADQMWIPRF